MEERTLRDLKPLEDTLLEGLRKINPNLDEDEAQKRIVQMADGLKQTPEVGLLLVRLAADSRVDVKAKIQLGLLSVNTITWGPVRFWSRTISSPAGWFVGPISFFNEIVAGLYGFYRLAQVLEETDPDVVASCWEGSEDALDELLENISAFNRWALENKLDKVFMVLSWIP